MTTNCTHLSLERLPLGVKGSEENAPLYSETQKDVCVCLWFWRFMSSLGKRAVFYPLMIRVKMFVCYRGSPSLLPQKSFRRSGTSSPVRCLSTPFRRLNGSRTPPSGKSISGVSRARCWWAGPLFPQTAASQTCRFGSNNPLQQLLLAPGHRDQELHPSSVPPSSVQLSASMSLQRQSGVGGGCCGFPRDKASSCSRHCLPGDQQGRVHRSHPSPWGM